MSDKGKQSFLYKMQHSVTVKNKQTIQFSSLVFTLSVRTTSHCSSHFDPHLATKKKSSVHFLTQVSFTKAPVKTKSKSFKTVISHL